MRKKIIILASMVFILLLALYADAFYQEHGKIIPYIGQLSKMQARDNVDAQPVSQKDATYTGSQKCKKCHEEQFASWKASYHSKMIQDPHRNSAVIVGDFATLPKEANFKKEDVAFTIGGKFKQRYMLHKEINGTQDFVVGNYQWNTQTKQWQGYKTYKDWYENGFEHNNSTIGTSKTCDGCHFTGFMSQGKRTEPAISCESCHGPASKHMEDPEENHLYEASNSDPKRATEVCLQCHMRNRDKRMEHTSMAALFGNVLDYPKGYEPGKPLHPYKMPAPFEGKETGEFYGNGVGKKNRTQGNEFVQSMMYKHGITCINCHDPHVLNSTTTKPLGDAVCMKCHTLGSAIGPHQATLEEHTHHKADSNGSSCIECHMPKTSRHLPESPLTVRTHTFGFITPKETQKYTVPNACNNCHSDKSIEWADKTLDKWGMSQWVKQP